MCVYYCIAYHCSSCPLLLYSTYTHSNMLICSFLSRIISYQLLLAFCTTTNDQLINKWWIQSYYFYINPCPEHYYPHSTPPPWKHQRYPYSPPPATCLPPKILLLNLGHTVKNALDLIRYLELEGFHPYSISRFVFCFFSMEHGGVGFGVPLMPHWAFCGGVSMFVPFRSDFRRPAHP